MQHLRWVATLTTAVLLSALAPLSGTALASSPDWPVVVRDGDWHLRQSQTSGGPTSSWSFGTATDLPVLGDWDGDGVATPGVYRDGRWHLSNSPSGASADISFFYGGRDDDFPLVGDWDGDGVDTVGVIRRGTWHLMNDFRGGAADVTFTYGRVGPRGEDVPLVGDWDGDGVDTVGIVRDGTWHLRNTNAGGPGETVFVYGRVGPRGDDLAVAGDWDADGQDTIGVVRGNTWHLRNANAGGAADVTFDYGLADDWQSVQGGFAETTRQDTAAAADEDDLALLAELAALGTPVAPVEFEPTEAVAFWFPEVADKAIAVADCESGLNPEAVNPRGFHGLFQISEQYHRSAFERVTGQSWADGIYVSYYNAQYARDLYERSGGWGPWPVCGS